ncbi:DUF1559 domain-containing protein [Stieleria sp. TO1_6]|uniref:DUF1559 domain-containing protein n=1 Tax=Stieleria tagensis TaxID=2956795 RepID=UPI00209B9D9F|nr:DUF1559 domain-containing protein [Stieleria tagensis]MCO8121688.1 DUF1559 domain-containing protein [Stieleria tagensis]
MERLKSFEIASRCSGGRRRDGFTILELLVSVSVIGILLALLLPAIGSARESARRIQCVNHLRQIGIALHNHHDAKRSLPAGWAFDPSGQSAYGWATSLLPYLEQSALADRLDLKKPVDATNHAVVRGTSLAVMLCPSDIAEQTFMLYAAGEDDEDDDDLRASVIASLGGDDAAALVQLPTANYVGMFGTIEPDDSIPAPIGDGAFLENRTTRFRDFGRGLSNTIIVGERTMAQVPSTWLGVSLQGEDAAARIVGSALEGINNPLADECDFSSRHPGGANFLWGDGRVTFVNEQIDLHEYHQFSQLRLHPRHSLFESDH